MTTVPPASDVTHLLLAWREGDAEALERLLPLVYEELHRLAHRRIRAERPVQPLQTTSPVHKAFVRLVDGARVPWNGRAHFFAICARLMRRILIDRARARLSEKRGGEAPHVPFEDWLAPGPAKAVEVLALDEALRRLAAEDPRKSKVVELRYFGGLTVEETAAVLEISPETVKRDWSVARLWLRHELKTASSAREPKNEAGSTDPG
jgi:RNA polymerase sigma-70 factor (ECF subfamily)